MCKWSDPFSRRVLIDRGLDQVRKHLYSDCKADYYSVLKARPSKTKYVRRPDKSIEQTMRNAAPGRPVSMTVRPHLFPFRTQKLSSLVPKIVGWTRPVKIGRCRLLASIRLLKPQPDGFIWPVGQAVKTEASHAFNIGSIPVRVTICTSSSVGRATDS